MSDPYNLQAIRQLLREAFDDSGIRKLAADQFPDVYEEFSAEMSKSRMIELLLDHARRHNRLETLLSQIKRRNPNKYSDYVDQIAPNQLPDAIPELEQMIAVDQQKLLRYEEMEQAEKDQRLRLRLQESLEDIRVKIASYESRIAEIRAANTPAPMARPQESVFIANVPYGLEAELYGREQELALLDDWFHRDPAHPLLAVIGLGGQGKSALTWQWQKQLQADKLAPPLVVWWSFYEQDGTMRALLAELLTHFGDDPTRFGSLRQAVDRLRQHLQQTPALIVLDGAERLLRAYSSMGAAYQGDDETADLQAATLERQQLRQCVDPAAGILLTWLADAGRSWRGAVGWGCRGCGGMI